MCIASPYLADQPRPRTYIEGPVLALPCDEPPGDAPVGILHALSTLVVDVVSAAVQPYFDIPNFGRNAFKGQSTMDSH